MSAGYDAEIALKAKLDSFQTVTWQDLVNTSRSLSTSPSLMSNGTIAWSGDFARTYSGTTLINSINAVLQLQSRLPAFDKVFQTDAMQFVTSDAVAARVARNNNESCRVHKTRAFSWRFDCPPTTARAASCTAIWHRCSRESRRMTARRATAGATLKQCADAGPHAPYKRPTVLRQNFAFVPRLQPESLPQIVQPARRDDRSNAANRGRFAPSRVSRD